MTDSGPHLPKFSAGGWVPPREPDVSHLPADCLTNRQLVARIDDEYRRTHAEGTTRKDHHHD